MAFKGGFICLIPSEAVPTRSGALLPDPTFKSSPSSPESYSRLRQKHFRSNTFCTPQEPSTSRENCRKPSSTRPEVRRRHCWWRQIVSILRKPVDLKQRSGGSKLQLQLPACCVASEPRMYLAFLKLQNKSKPTNNKHNNKPGSLIKAYATQTYYEQNSYPSTLWDGSRVCGSRVGVSLKNFPFAVKSSWSAKPA